MGGTGRLRPAQPRLLRVLPASPRAGGAGPRAEITERPFAYCENCTGGGAGSGCGITCYFPACQAAQKPSPRLSPRSQGPRGRGGSGLPRGCRLGPGWGSPASQLLHPAHGASVSTKRGLLPLGHRTSSCFTGAKGKFREARPLAWGHTANTAILTVHARAAGLTLPHELRSPSTTRPWGHGDPGGGAAPRPEQAGRLTTARGPVAPSPPHHGFRFPLHKGV